MEFNNTYDWDYLGYEKLPGNKDFGGLTQNDWNQTLITRINQASAQIAKDSYRGSANVIYMHPKTFTIIKKLEYYDASSNTLSGRYAIVIDDKLPKDKIYVKLDFERNKSNIKLPENHIFGIHKKIDKQTNQVELGEITLTILEIGSEKYNECLNNPEYTILTDKLLTAEITVLNHRTIDPVTGEILIDYHNEISQDIWLGTYPEDKELNDLVLVRDISNEEMKKFLEERIQKLKELNNPLITAEPYQRQLTDLNNQKITVKKPWYKRVLRFFSPKEQVKIKNVKDSKININIK